MVAIEFVYDLEELDNDLLAFLNINRVLFNLDYRIKKEFRKLLTLIVDTGVYQYYKINVDNYSGISVYNINIDFSKIKDFLLTNNVTIVRTNNSYFNRYLYAAIND